MSSSQKARIASYALTLLGVAILSYAAHLLTRFPLDLELARWLQGFRSSLMDQAMKTASLLGAEWVAMFTVLLAVLVLWAVRFRIEAALVALLTSTGYLLSLLLKALVHRPRPDAELLQILVASNRHSFPSGHALFVIIFYGFLLYLVSTRLKNRAARLSLQFLLGGLILLVGLSRVYLGAHWPSDVAGAYLIGGGLLFLFFPTYWRLRRSRSQPSG